jgi:hypothetical protein
MTGSKHFTYPAVITPGVPLGHVDMSGRLAAGYLGLWAWGIVADPGRSPCSGGRVFAAPLDFAPSPHGAMSLTLHSPSVRRSACRGGVASQAQTSPTGQRKETPE